jgi:outer membrane receptor protein involved in Fe transport
MKHLLAVGAPILLCAGNVLAQSASSPELAEIVVTATKRAENIQDIPVSVSVESGAAMLERGQSSLLDYSAYMPGFNVSNGGTPGTSSVQLRGISTQSSTSAVGTYVDDTPLGGSSGWVNSSTTTLDLLPYDLERLELLRGPQGTLYGAGAMGGLIKYVMKSPSTTQSEASVGAEISDTDGAGKLGYVYSARVSEPLVDNVLGVSLSLFDKQAPGWMTNLANDQQHTNDTSRYGGRAAVLWTPTQDLTVKLSAMVSNINAEDGATRQFTTSQTVPNTGSALIIAPLTPLPLGTENVQFYAPYTQRLQYYSATVDWNLQSVDLISASSYSSQRSFYQQDFTQQVGGLLGEVGGTGPGIANADYGFGVDKITQEFRVVSPKGQTVDWMLGTFTTHESSTNSQFLNAFNPNGTPMAGLLPPSGVFYAALPEVYDEYAAFGDLTVKVTDQFDLLAGARYAHNDQDWNATVTPGPLVNEFGFFHVGTHEGVFTWMAGAEYHFDADNMLYLRAATGYRPGGPNSPIAGVPPTEGSDSLTNYELGLKSTFLERRAQVDMAVFRIDWKDIQLTAVNAQNLSYGANGGTATSQGVEFAGTYLPIDSLTLGLNAAYTDAHLTSVIPQASYLLTGYQLPLVPKVSFSVTADYQWSLSGGWSAYLGGAYRYVGAEWLGVVESNSPVSTPAVQASAYAVGDLNASVRNEHLTFKAYVRNLANNHAITGPSNQGLVVTNGATGNHEVFTSYLEPRTVGIGVDYKF